MKAIFGPESFTRLSADELTEEERMRKKLEELVQISDLLITGQEAIEQPTVDAIDNDENDDYAQDEALGGQEDDYDQPAQQDEHYALPQKTSAVAPAELWRDKYPSVLDNDGILDDYQQIQSRKQIIDNIDNDNDYAEELK